MPTNDPWYTPTLKGLGEQFRQLERREAREARTRKHRRQLVAPSVVLAGAIASILL